MNQSNSNSVTNIYQGDDGLREQIVASMTEHRVSQARLAKEAGISGATLSQWLSGNYRGNNETIDSKLSIWQESHNARVAVGYQLPDVPGYVNTPTASRVVGALSYAQVAGDIAATYGAAGLGKTSACRHYQTTRPSVWIATMSPACAGVVTALEEICDALGITEGGGARRMSREITKRVRDTLGLLIIDEAQHLSVAALDQIRSIHDATGIGIALVGNEGVYARMAGGRNAVQLDRLYSRIGKRLALRRCVDGDIKALVRAWGVTDTQCEKVLVEIARRRGGLRALTKTLRLASMEAAAQGRPLCCTDIRAASRELGGA